VRNLALRQRIIMGDILSAASLLLAIVTVLYALWYQELTAAIEIEIPNHKEDRPKPLTKLNQILFSRAIPLFLSSVTVSVVFLPDAITIVTQVIDVLSSGDATDNFVYSSVKTAVCIVVIFSIGITVHSGSILIKIMSLKGRMKK
jgi:hypothetical protein